MTNKTAALSLSFSLAIPRDLSLCTRSGAMAPSFALSLSRSLALSLSFSLALLLSCSLLRLNLLNFGKVCAGVEATWSSSYEQVPCARARTGKSKQGDLPHHNCVCLRSPPAALELLLSRPAPRFRLSTRASLSPASSFFSCALRLAFISPRAPRFCLPRASSLAPCASLSPLHASLASPVSEGFIRQHI